MLPIKFHPTEFIHEELAERGWSVRDLVFRMRRYESERDWAVNCLAVELYLTGHDTGILPAKMAEEFGVAFGVSPEYFINLHQQWREDLDRD